MNVAGKQWQPVATDLACFRGFGRRGICHWLPLVATTGLHKGSILWCEPGARADASAGHPPQYAVSTRRSNAFATTGEGGESLTMTTIWRVASLLEYAIVL